MLAPNADMMTLDGTNTWVLSSGSQSLVIDPGPSIESHLAAISAVGQDVVGVLLTHHHLDHSEAARDVRLRARLWRAGAGSRLPPGF